MKNIKKILAIALSMLLIVSAVPFSAFADEGTDVEIIASGACGENVSWELDSEGTLTISGTGEMYDCIIGDRPYETRVITTTSLTDNSGNTFLNSRNDLDLSAIKKVIINPGITHIGNEAFTGCTNLTSISIPYTVSSIGFGILTDCNGLKTITIDENNDYFCTENNFIFSKDKKTVVYYPAIDTDSQCIIPEGVTKIGQGAFLGCYFSDIKIPNSVTYIDDGAFVDCENLKSITMSENTEYIGMVAFYGCLSLESITMPENTEYIGEGAFFACESIKSVTLSENIEYIGPVAFAFCYDLEDITIYNSEATIEESVFVLCDKVTIHGYEGSTAQSYALENDIPFEAINSSNADVFVFKLNDENIYYANQDVKFSAGTPATFSADGKTLVPLRTIAGAVGIDDLEYDAATSEITFTDFMGNTVTMTLGSSTFTISNGSDVQTFNITAPVIINYTTMLPLREVSALVGGTVEYYVNNSNSYIVVSAKSFDVADVPGYVAAYEAK